MGEKREEKLTLGCYQQTEIEAKRRGRERATGMGEAKKMKR
jgi:hypothetical protein